MFEARDFPGGLDRVGVVCLAVIPLGNGPTRGSEAPRCSVLPKHTAYQAYRDAFSRAAFRSAFIRERSLVDSRLGGGSLRLCAHGAPDRTVELDGVA